MTSYPWRRRNFFIKREFQGKFILVYAAALIGVAGLTTWLLSIKISNALEWHLYSSHLQVERTGDFMIGLLVETNAIAILAILGLIILLTVVIVNRLNHHFLRMGLSVKAMADGDFTTPAQSPSQFHEITNVINLCEEMKMHYREKFARINEALQFIEIGCRGDGDTDQLRKGRNQLDQLLSQVYLPE